MTAEDVTDHPRSRGVYTQLLCQIETMVGSSPLARGLPVLEVSDNGADRIIPARAGFTLAARIKAAEAKDHPRSRGVYLPPPGLWRLGPGSSPLARGLLECVCDRGPRPRIIPARAGFTLNAVAGGNAETDHPRSREVYFQ